MSESMNRQELDVMLAEYLGGELSGDRREAFERELCADPPMAANVSSLRASIDAMRSMTNETEARITRRPAVPRFLQTSLRYAAVIAMAFVAGYLARGGHVATEHITRQEAGPQMARTGPVTDWEQRAAQIYARNAGSGGSMERTLIALSQTAGTTRR